MLPGVGDKPGDDDRRSNRLDPRNRSPPFADPLIDLATAAPLSPSIAEFFAGIGMQILNVYGQSECTGLCSFNRPDRNRIGSVGPALPGIELAIAQDGEI